MFAGGWTLEAAESVCAGEDLERDEVLESARASGGQVAGGGAEQDGEARYRLLETVRQYGWEKLSESGEEGTPGAAGGTLPDAGGRGGAGIEGRGAGGVAGAIRAGARQPAGGDAMVAGARGVRRSREARLGAVAVLVDTRPLRRGTAVDGAGVNYGGSAAMPPSARAKALFVAGTMACGRVITAQPKRSSRKA